MAKFIELTKKDSGLKILIAIDKIKIIEKFDNYSIIIILHHRTRRIGYCVEENYDEINEQLIKGGNARLKFIELTNSWTDKKMLVAVKEIIYVEKYSKCTYIMLGQSNRLSCGGYFIKESVDEVKNILSKINE